MKKEPVKMPAFGKGTQVGLVTPDDLAEFMEQIYEAISRRSYEIFEGHGRTPGQDLDDWLKAEAELVHPVHLDVADRESALVVSAAVPGFHAAQLKVSVEPRRVVIIGKRETREGESKGKGVSGECRSDHLFRTLDLPVEVDPSKAVAVLKDGKLELKMRKVPRAQEIAIQEQEKVA